MYFCIQPLLQLYLVVPFPTKLNHSISTTLVQFVKRSCILLAQFDKMTAWFLMVKAHNNQKSKLIPWNTKSVSNRHCPTFLKYLFTSLYFSKERKLQPGIGKAKTFRYNVANFLLVSVTVMKGKGRRIRFNSS